MKIPGIEALIRELNEELRTDPSNTTLLYKLGRACEASGQRQEALRHFEAIVRLEPEDHESVHAAGLLHYQLGSFAGAIRELQRATAMCDEQPDYFADLGDALRSSGEGERARLAYEKALALTLPHEEVAERIRAALEKLPPVT
jgi:Flp pilus assembly protein TadD